MNKNITFVVLHYKAFDATKQCIDSILKLNYYNYNVNIVVVDNGSNDGSYEKIVKTFSDKENFYLIQSEKNIGFARGNNLGFDYAKKKLKSDFIILSNNDVIFNQASFIKQLILEYNKYNFSVLGPKILLPSGDTFVFRNKLRSTKKERLLIITLYIRYFLAIFYLHNIYIYLKYKRDNKYGIKNKFVLENVLTDVPVHGCCFCFSKNFIDHFDGLDSRTFLYCEEELLYLMIKKKHLISIYDPSLYIFHNHSTSVNSIMNNSRNKELFIVKNMIRSNWILLKTMKEVDIDEK